MIRFHAQAEGKPDCLLALVPTPSSPRPGERWHVRSLRLVADSPTSIPNGNGDEHLVLYVGIPPAGSANGALNADLDAPQDNADDYMASYWPLPVSEFFPPWAVVVETGEVLYAVVWCGSGDGAQARTYTLTGTATEEPQR